MTFHISYAHGFCDAGQILQAFGIAHLIFSQA